MQSHSLFGRVVRGLAVLRNALALPRDAEDRPSEMIVIANTSATADGPIPEDFTIPQQPSLRPNPMVPPACDSLLGTKGSVGLAHKFTQQRQSYADSVTVGDSHDETPINENETPTNNESETPINNESETPTNNESETPINNENETPINNETPLGGAEDTGDERAPGVDASEEPVDYNLQAMQAAQAYGYYYQPMPQVQETYAPVYTAPAGMPQESGEAPPGEEEALEAPSSFISNAMDDFRRGSMPRDTDGRALMHYLDLSTLEHHTAKKKANKIPKGFKTWKEYGEFKKKEKRARQVHDILEDKYPVEYLERRRHHCIVCATNTTEHDRSFRGNRRHDHTKRSSEQSTPRPPWLDRKHRALQLIVHIRILQHGELKGKRRGRDRNAPRLVVRCE